MFESPSNEYKSSMYSLALAIEVLGPRAEESSNFINRIGHLLIMECGGLRAKQLFSAVAHCVLLLKWEGCCMGKADGNPLIFE